jgi:hypothetical protein
MLLLFIVLTTQSVFAQNNTTPGHHKVSGIVFAESNQEPLPGVNILMVGTTIGGATDADGKFTFPVALTSGDKIVFSFLGFTPQTFTVSGSEDENITIRMKEDAEIMIELASTDVFCATKTHHGLLSLFKRN